MVRKTETSCHLLVFWTNRDFIPPNFVRHSFRQNRTRKPTAPVAAKRGGKPLLPWLRNGQHDESSPSDLRTLDPVETGNQKRPQSQGEASALDNRYAERPASALRTRLKQTLATGTPFTRKHRHPCASSETERDHAVGPIPPTTVRPGPACPGSGRIRTGTIGCLTMSLLADLAAGPHVDTTPAGQCTAPTRFAWSSARHCLRFW